jgi:hypothetical protein
MSGRRRFLLCFVGLIGVAACTGKRHIFEHTMVSEIQKTCASQSKCRVSLRDATHFEWDRMYVFDYTVGRDEIEQVLGCAFPDYEEMDKRYIFMNKGKIVHSENSEVDIEKPRKNELLFDIPPRSHYLNFGPDSTFEVTKDSLEDGTPFFDLTEIKNKQ